MINPDLFLNPKIFDEDVERKPTRDGYGNGLVEAAEKDERVVVLCADLAESTRSEQFQKQFPSRFIEVGVAEQNMASLAAGAALGGKVAFISSYAAFSPGRNNEQIRTTIALNKVNVKIAGAHAGVSVGPDGATHQALEDIALMRVMPRMKVFVPCDAEEARKATVAAAALAGPVYIRFAREATPILTTFQTPFDPALARVFWTGDQATIIAAGPLLFEALVAAKHLEEEGIACDVINCAIVKPLDGETILNSVRKTGAVVTVEEHQIMGGVGSAVAEFLAMNNPVPMEMVGMRDRFGESGTAGELLEAFHLTHPFIVEAVKKVLQRKLRH